MKTKEYNSNFIGNFKTGDNIIYNLKILKRLYSAYESENKTERLLLIKPMIIIIGSLTEAILFDFIYRLKTFNREGVNIAPKITASIKQTKGDDFEKLVSIFKNNNILKLKSYEIDFYEDLSFLRKIRNRLHIQNKWRDLEKDEDEVYTQERLIKSEEIFERLIIIMSEIHTRKIKGHVDPLILPWSSHYPLYF